MHVVTSKSSLLFFLASSCVEVVIKCCYFPTFHQFRDHWHQLMCQGCNFGVHGDNSFAHCRHWQRWLALSFWCSPDAGRPWWTPRAMGKWRMWECPFLLGLSSPSWSTQWATSPELTWTPQSRWLLQSAGTSPGNRCTWILHATKWNWCESPGSQMAYGLKVHQDGVKMVNSLLVMEFSYQLGGAIGMKIWDCLSLHSEFWNREGTMSHFRLNWVLRKKERAESNLIEVTLTN